MSKPTEITVNGVMELRERLGISVFEARRILLKQATLEAIDQAENLDELKIILRTIVENWVMK